MFHGGGGFKHSEVYNMPIWMRMFHINKISEYNKEQNKKQEEAQKGISPNSKMPKGPAISPSSVYNFKK